MYGSFIRISMPVSPGAFAYPGAHNIHRPHRALKLQPPQPREPPPTATSGQIERRDRLGGLIHEYYRTAA
jgi:putative transposase